MPVSCIGCNCDGGAWAKIGGQPPLSFNINNSKYIATIIYFVRRYAIALLGWTTILLGLVIGPIVVLVPLGAAILAWEFPWARRGLRRVKLTLRHRWRQYTRRRQSDAAK